MKIKMAGKSEEATERPYRGLTVALTWLEPGTLQPANACQPAALQTRQNHKTAAAPLYRLLIDTLEPPRRSIVSQLLQCHKQKV